MTKRNKRPANKKPVFRKEDELKKSDRKTYVVSLDETETEKLRSKLNGVPFSHCIGSLIEITNELIGAAETKENASYVLGIVLADLSSYSKSKNILKAEPES